MLNFTFHNPTRIHFGKGQIKKITTEIPHSAKVLMLYGGGSIKKNGVYEQVTQSLSQHSWIEFSGIEANPCYETLMNAVEYAKSESIDYILAVGGGSVSDGAKFIAAACCYNNGEDPWLLVAKKRPITQSIPLGVVLTLPGTGSESNMGSVISRGEDKIGFSSPLLQPKFSILDPSTTFSLPREQVCNGIVDAFVHVVEQYIAFDVNAKVQDRFAEGLLLTLIEEAPKALLESTTSYETKANIMWTATLSLNGLIGAGVPSDWATHMIGHELSALYGYDHARTLAMLLPTLWKIRKEHKKDKLLQYAQRVWGITQGSEDEKIDLAIEKTIDFFNSLGMICHIPKPDIDIDKIIQQLEKHGMVKLGEKGDIDLSVSRRILEIASGKEASSNTNLGGRHMH